jgi:acyl-CoA dehydrogenase
MALTEAHCGSDSSAIRTRAVRDGNSWVLNGEKLFVTSARKAMIDSNGVMVVWATVDPSAGRAGIKPFLVESGTPGVKITKLEKLGYRSSDTAVVLLGDCRIPLENLLGAMGQRFQRGNENFLILQARSRRQRVGYCPGHLGFSGRSVWLSRGSKSDTAFRAISSTSIEREIIDMEAQLRAAWLLVVRAGWLVDQNRRNTLESSMAK